MKSKSFDYLNHIKEILDKISETQWDMIDTCSKLMADTIAFGHGVFVYGASHSSIIAQEMFYRAGGLAIINPIMPSEVMLNARPITLTTTIERLEGYAEAVLKHTPIRSGDLLIIHPVSGRNALAIEMAAHAKEMGVTTIAMTNMTYSKQLTSRHSSGKKLYEVCDFVLDDCGDFEDASTLIPGLDQKAAATSTVAGASIVNMMLIRCIEYLLEMGIEPPVFRSANADGGDAFNNKLFEEYKDRIHYT